MACAGPPTEPSRGETPTAIPLRHDKLNSTILHSTTRPPWHVIYDVLAEELLLSPGLAEWIKKARRTRHAAGLPTPQMHL